MQNDKEDVFYVEYNYDKIRDDLKLYSIDMEQTEEELFGSSIKDLSDDELLFYSSQSDIHFKAKKRMNQIGYENVKKFLEKFYKKMKTPVIDISDVPEEDVLNLYDSASKYAKMKGWKI